MKQILHVKVILQQDGELHLDNLPFQRGQELEVAIQVQTPPITQTTFSAQQLLASGLIGVWADRIDIPRTET